MNAKKRIITLFFLLAGLSMLSCMYVQSLILPPTPTPTEAPTMTPVTAPTEATIPTEISAPPTLPPASALTITGCTSSDECPNAIRVNSLFGENTDLFYKIEYKAAISADKELRFYTGWCTIDDVTLDENLSKIKYVFTIDGVSYVDQLKKEYFTQTDSNNTPMSCYGEGGVVSGWEEGRTYHITFGNIFEEDIFDGWDVYPAEERVLVYAITVGAGTSDNWKGIPIISGAYDAGEEIGDYQFTTSASADEIKEYYKNEMKLLGWELRPDLINTVPTDLAFKKGNTYAFFKILPDGINNKVLIHLVEQ